MFNKLTNQVQQKSFERLLGAEELHGKKILEIGCGIGRWSKFFEQANWFGLDISQNMLSNAAKHLSTGSLLCSPGATLPFKDAQFDLVYSITVLQHMPNDQQKLAAKEIVRVTKTSGSVILMEDILKRKSPSAFMHANSPEEWISMFELAGSKFVTCAYDKYYFLYSLYKIVIRSFLGRKLQTENTAFEQFIYYLSLLEPYYQSLLPRRLASGICLKFIKQAA